MHSKLLFLFFNVSNSFGSTSRCMSIAPLCDGMGYIYSYVLFLGLGHKLCEDKVILVLITGLFYALYFVAVEVHFYKMKFQLSETICDGTLLQSRGSLFQFHTSKK